jgi:YD repeat-containing protein
MVREVTVYGDGTVLRRSEYLAEDHGRYARITQERQWEYEAEQAGAPAERTVFYVYDDYGNVTETEERATAGEPVKAVIRYRHDAGRYLHAHPEELTVYRGDGYEPVRHRKGYYDGNGSLIRLERFDGRGTVIETRLERDGYGNLTRMTDGNGAWMRFGYDGRHQYVNEITRGGNGAGPYRSFIQGYGLIPETGRCCGR